MIIAASAYFAGLIGLLIVTNFSRRAINELFFLLFESKKAGIIVYSTLYFPGTVIHEISHFLMAALLGVRTGAISLFPKFESEDGRVQLGSVQVEKTDFIRSSLIGAAPFITGSIVLIYFASTLGWLEIWQKLPQLDTLLESASKPFFLIKVYLMLAISNTLFTSKEDRRHWPVFLVILAITTIALEIIGISLSFSQAISQKIVVALFANVTAFVLAIILNGVLLSIIRVMILITQKITKKRVTYR